MCHAPGREVIPPLALVEDVVTLSSVEAMYGIWDMVSGSHERAYSAIRWRCSSLNYEATIIAAPVGRVHAWNHLAATVVLGFHLEMKSN